MDHHHHGDGEDGGSFYVHLIAGAAAGFAEHCGMYPIDTIKVYNHSLSLPIIKPSDDPTHIQAVRPGFGVTHFQGPIQTTREIIQRFGVMGLFRGVTAVAAGAAPSHAIHFSAYELLKHKFIGDDENHHPIKVGAAGALATMASEAVACPMDVVKQRMQLQLTQYKGLGDCMKRIWVKEGIRGFYAGYTTTLAMGIPYNVVYFSSYESLKKIIESANGTDQQVDYTKKKYQLLLHLVAGGGAGVAAAAFTNPFDVAKTRLQTQGEVGKHYRGMLDALKTIWKEEGSQGYLRGIRPRIVFHSMSSAIVWSVYEYFKFILE
eukprot:gene7909-9735_t